MIEITRKIEWDMAHRLPFHKGKCSNLHGHRYVFELTVSAPLVDAKKDSSEGMVIDFGDIKTIMMTHVHDLLDHGCMWYEGDPKREAIMSLTSEWNHIVVPFIPTAENMAKWIYDIMIVQFGDTPIVVKNVRIFETPNSYADYYVCNTSKQDGKI